MTSIIHRYFQLRRHHSRVTLSLIGFRRLSSDHPTFFRQARCTCLTRPPRQTFIYQVARGIHQSEYLRQSSFNWPAFLVLTSIVCVSLSLKNWCRIPSPEAETLGRDFSAAAEAMSADIPAGRPGNLTADQEEKLRRLWSLVLQLSGVSEDENGHVIEGNEVAPPALQKQASLKPESVKPKKKRLSLFSRKGKGDKGDKGDKVAEAEPAASTPATNLEAIKERDHEDKYGETKQFLDALANQTPEALRAAIWSMVKHDHPDALVLRFLRARKWDVDKALVMLISTMNWRATEMHVDDDIMKNGEAGAVAAENGQDAAAKKLGHDFLAQIRMGKSFLHGVDNSGRPICVVRVRLHKQGEQAEESLERYTVYIIETARMVLSPPVDTAVGFHQGRLL
jgi:hypothetical protein